MIAKPIHRAQSKTPKEDDSKKSRNKPEITPSYINDVQEDKKLTTHSITSSSKTKNGKGAYDAAAKQKKSLTIEEEEHLKSAAKKQTGIIFQDREKSGDRLARLNKELTKNNKQGSLINDKIADEIKNYNHLKTLQDGHKVKIDNLNKEIKDLITQTKKSNLENTDNSQHQQSDTKALLKKNQAILKKDKNSLESIKKDIAKSSKKIRYLKDLLAKNQVQSCKIIQQIEQEKKDYEDVLKSNIKYFTKKHLQIIDKSNASSPTSSSQQKNSDKITKYQNNLTKLTKELEKVRNTDYLQSLESDTTSITSQEERDLSLELQKLLSNNEDEGSVQTNLESDQCIGGNQISPTPSLIDSLVKCDEFSDDSSTVNGYQTNVSADVHNLENESIVDSQSKDLDGIASNSQQVQGIQLTDLRSALQNIEINPSPITREEPDDQLSKHENEETIQKINTQIDQLEQDIKSQQENINHLKQKEEELNLDSLNNQCGDFARKILNNHDEIKRLQNAITNSKSSLDSLSDQERSARSIIIDINQKQLKTKMEEIKKDTELLNAYKDDLNIRRQEQNKYIQESEQSRSTINDMDQQISKLREELIKIDTQQIPTPIFIPMSE